MTSVASTSYYPSTSSRANAGPAGRASESAYTALYGNQEREAKPQAEAAVEAAGPNASVEIAPSKATFNLQGKLIEISWIGKASDLREIKPDWENPEGLSEQLLRGFEEDLKYRYTYMPEESDPSNKPLTKPYADIVVKGKVVATIDNQGIVTSKDDVLKERYRTITASASGTVGPDLAQRIANDIARAIGGRVVKQDTALTQAQVEALPQPEPPKPWVDYDAMYGDTDYVQLQEMKQKRDDYLALLQTGGANQA